MAVPVFLMHQSADFVQLALSALGRIDDSLPLYVRLARALNEALEGGDVDRNPELPSERTLSARLGISRVTVRKSLDELARAGMLRRRQGARTVVAKRVQKTLSTLTGFSDELRARGSVPGHRWLSRQTVLPTPSEAMALGIAGDDAVVRLVRVRLADGRPLAIERATVPQAILPSGELVGASLYEALTSLGAAPVRGMQRIRAGIMTQVDATLLEHEVGAPLLIIERRCFLADGRAVEFTETRYNGESYDFLTGLGV